MTNPTEATHASSPRHESVSVGITSITGISATPAEAAFLLDGRAAPEAVVATMLDLTLRGALDVDAQDDNWLFTRGETSAGPLTSAEERLIAEMLRDGASAVSLRTLRPRMPHIVDVVTTQVGQDLVEHDWCTANPLLGGMLQRRKAKRTAAGDEEAARAGQLRDALAQHGERVENPDARIAAYAVALGHADAWAESLAHAGTAEPGAIAQNLLDNRVLVAYFVGASGTLNVGVAAMALNMARAN